MDIESACVENNLKLLWNLSDARYCVSRLKLDIRVMLLIKLTLLIKLSSVEKGRQKIQNMCRVSYLVLILDSTVFTREQQEGS